MIDQILKDHSDYLEIDIFYNGALSAATSVTILEMKDPSGDVIGTNLATVAGDTVGRYRYLVPAGYVDENGVYTAIWQFTVDSTVFNHTQYFEVVSALTSGYISPIEVRNSSTYSKITSTTPDDATLQKYIDKSTQIIDTYLGGSLLYSQYVDKVRCVLDKPNNGYMIPLKHRPILSLTSLSLETYPSHTYVVDTDLIRIREDAGYLDYYGSYSEDLTTSYPLQACARGYSETGIIPVATVVYTAGYTSIPEDVKLAAVMIVESLFKETGGDDRFMTRMTIGDYTEQYSVRSSSEQSRSSLGDGGWIAAQKILNKYKQPSQSAGFVGILG